MSSILSDIIAQRSLGGAGAVVQLTSELVVVIGTSLGTNTAVAAAEAVTKDAGHIDSLVNSVEFRKILWVANTLAGTGRRFTEDLQFVMDGNGALDWTDAPALLPPVVDKLTLNPAGGTTFPLDEYGYAAVVTDASGVETSIGNYKLVEVTDANQSVTVDFVVPDGAVGSTKIFRTDVITAGVPDFTGGTVVSFTTTGSQWIDTGTAGTTETPAATNLTADRPADAATYYVNYEYATYSHLTPALFGSVADVEVAHGVGSDLTNAALLVLDKTNGNGAPGMIAVSVSEDTVAQYQAALTVLESYPYGNYIICLKHNDVLDQSGKTHAVAMSADDIKKERFYVSCVEPDIAIGDASTAGTIIYKIASYLGSNRVVVPVLEGNSPVMSRWQETDGTYTYNVATTNAQFFAVAFAARKCALPDVAEDLCGKQVIGFNIPETVSLWSVVEKEAIVTAGGAFVNEEVTNCVVNRSNTTSLASVEDQTLSIMSAEDELRRQVRNAGDPFRGKKITTARLGAFRTFIKGVLDTLVAEEIITTFAGLATYQDPDNQQKLACKFRYKAVYSAIWIEFNYGFIPGD